MQAIQDFAVGAYRWFNVALPPRFLPTKYPTDGMDRRPGIVQRLSNLSCIASRTQVDSLPSALPREIRRRGWARRMTPEATTLGSTISDVPSEGSSRASA